MTETTYFQEFIRIELDGTKTKVVKGIRVVEEGSYRTEIEVEGATRREVLKKLDRLTS